MVRHQCGRVQQLPLLAYCGYGDSYGDSCYYPFLHNGETYYECADKTGTPWCATSVYY